MSPKLDSPGSKKESPKRCPRPWGPLGVDLRGRSFLKPPCRELQTRGPSCPPHRASVGLKHLFASGFNGKSGRVTHRKNKSHPHRSWGLITRRSVAEAFHSNIKPGNPATLCQVLWGKQETRSLPSCRKGLGGNAKRTHGRGPEWSFSRRPEVGLDRGEDTDANLDRPGSPGKRSCVCAFLEASCVSQESKRASSAMNSHQSTCRTPGGGRSAAPEASQVTTSSPPTRSPWGHVRQQCPGADG